MSNEIEEYCKNNKVFFAGKIPFDPSVTEALVNRKSVIEYSGGPAAERIKDIWDIVKNGLQ